MGCEGGSIPKRNELVKTKKVKGPAKDEFRDQNDWFFCRISKTPLTSPIAADRLGRLYNKDNVIKCLLSKSSLNSDPTLSKSVNSLKDVATLKMTINPSFNRKSDDFSESSIHGNITRLDPIARFICPITRKEMNGKIKFSFIFSCGCVFSDQALKMLPGLKCPVCEAPYDQDDLIPINPLNEEDIERLNQKLIAIRKNRFAMEEARRKIQTGECTQSTDSFEANYDTGFVTSKKRSLEDKPRGSVKKRCHTKKADRRQNINVPISDIISQRTTSIIKNSEAVKSLYKKKETRPNSETYLTMGTFNRFAATF